jgi:hypothetical protein
MRWKPRMKRTPAAYETTIAFDDVSDESLGTEIDEFARLINDRAVLGLDEH